MKKFLKDNLKILITVIVTTIIVSTTTVFAYSLIASDVSFTPKDSNWEVNNVKGALDDLAVRAKDVSMNFSTNEKAVGKWIDGKTIYQKTIYYSASGGTSATIATFTDIDTMVDITGYVVENSIMYNVNNFNCRLRYNISNSTLYWEGRVNWSPFTGYATIRYTKK